MPSSCVGSCDSYLKGADADAADKRTLREKAVRFKKKKKVRHGCLNIRALSLSLSDKRYDYCAPRHRMTTGTLLFSSSSSFFFKKESLLAAFHVRVEFKARRRWSSREADLTFRPVHPGGLSECNGSY